LTNWWRGLSLIEVAVLKSEEKRSFAMPPRVISGSASLPHLSIGGGEEGAEGGKMTKQRAEKKGSRAIQIGVCLAAHKVG